MSQILEVTQTKQWIEEIIIDLNFCPFAKKEFLNNTICYHISKEKQIKAALVEFTQQCEYLLNHPEIETTLIIFDAGFRRFELYLDLIHYAEELLVELEYEGIFQLASLHPEYCFGGEEFDDAANYTNRSPYPTIHIIREESIARVLNVYKDPENIPVNNISLARQKGSTFFEDKLRHFQKHSS